MQEKSGEAPNDSIRGKCLLCGERTRIAHPAQFVTLYKD